jgi:leader peptidase (prepilin peptidase) / N-methyltransferase
MSANELIIKIIQCLLGGLLGLASAGLAGHFGYRSADRLPGESLKPHCVFCLRPFQWFEIVPLFGWLLRPAFPSLPCPCGKQKGLWPQPLAEVTGFLLGVVAVALAGWSWAIVPLCLGLGLLPAIALVDLFFGLIPDGLNIILGFFGLLWLIGSGGDVFLGIITATGLLAFSLFLAIVYSKWRGREVLGLGDVKFFTAAGLWLPLVLVPWFLATAGLIGSVFGLVWKRLGGGKEFPFAPALCVALAGCVFYSLTFS